MKAARAKIEAARTFAPVALRGKLDIITACIDTDHPTPVLVELLLNAAVEMEAAGSYRACVENALLEAAILLDGRN